MSFTEDSLEKKKGMRKMKRHLALFMSMMFTASLAPTALADTQKGTVYAQDLMEYQRGQILQNTPANGGTGFAAAWEAAECDFDGYVPQVDITIGTMGSISMNSGAGNKCGKIMRKFQTAISTADAYDYVIEGYYKLYELDADSCARVILGADKETDNLYAGIDYNEEKGGLYPVVKVGDNTAWGTTQVTEKVNHIKFHVRMTGDGTVSVEASNNAIGAVEMPYEASASANLGTAALAYIKYDGDFGPLRSDETKKQRWFDVGPITVTQYTTAEYDAIIEKDEADEAEIENTLRSYNGSYTKGMYDYLNGLADSGAKSKFLAELAENFRYEPIDYAKCNDLMSIDLTGGFGFGGKWYAVGAAFNLDTPWIGERAGDNFLVGYNKDTKLRRNLATPIDPTKDGEYYMSFRYNDSGNGDEIRRLDTRIGLGENLYAGVYYDETENGYFVQGSVDERAIGGTKRSWGEIYNNNNNETVIWDFVVRISIDADGDDTMKVKMWREGTDEKAGWDVVTRGEIGTAALEFMQISNNGHGVGVDELMLESWNPQDIAAVSSLVDNFDRNNTELIRGKIESLPQGLAKTEFLLEYDQKLERMDKITASGTEYSTAGGLEAAVGAESVLVSTMLDNGFAEDKTVALIMAVYENGKLVKVVSKPETLPANEPKYVTWGFDGATNKLPNSIKNNTTIKAFVWDGVKGQCPMLTLPQKFVGTGEDAQVASLPSVNIYVDKNVQNGDGSEERPFSSVSGAKSYIRGLVMNNKLPQDGICVNIKGGVYKEQLMFTAKDSGKAGAPIVYRACDGEKAEIAGGYEFRAEDFSAVTDENILARLNPAVRDKVVCLDLAERGIDYSRDLPITGHSTAYFEDYDYNSTPYYTLSFEGEKTSIAKYPNDGYIKVKSVTDTGLSGTAKTGFTITADDAHISGWEKEKDLYLHGFWSNDWSDLRVRVAETDAAKGTITSQTPTPYAVREGANFFVYNALCELDSPGEWYLDKAEGKLYFYPPRRQGKVIFGTDTGNVITLNSAQHIYFDGLDISSGGGNGVEIIAGKDIGIYNSNIHDTGKLGVKIDGDCENCRVEKCLVYYTGEGGISISGGVTATLQRGENVVKNSVVRAFSGNSLAYAPGITIAGIGNSALHNMVYDAPHMAVRIMGNDNTVMYNDIFDVLKYVDDSGAIYAFQSKINRGNVIENNYIHDLKSTISGTYHGIYGVYLDNMFDGTIINKNVFADIDGYGVFVNGGRNNTFTNNIGINLTKGMARMSCMGVAYGYTVDSDFLDKAGLSGDLHKSAAYAKYPNLADILSDEPLKAKYNLIKNNVALNSEDIKLTDIGGVDMYAINTIEASAKYTSDPGFADFSGKDYTLRDDSAVYEKLSGFTAPEFSDIGIEIR